MDLDPTRCRRTDGKKWRCRNDVVPNEKYCQKHMHRGSKRSRKLVEASKTVVDMNENPNSNLRVRFPASLILGLHGNKRSGNVVEGWKPAVNTEITSLRNVNRESILANAASVASSLSDDSRFGRGSSTSQPGRCIRTDGQRWRCSRDVLPHQKYCTLHIHRGSKKLLEATTLGSTELQEAMPCSHNLVVKSSSDIVAPEMKKHVEATTGGEEESSEATVVDDGSDVSNMLAHSP